MLTVKFDRDYWNEVKERRKKRKEMRDNTDIKLAQAEADRERMMLQMQLLEAKIVAVLSNVALSQ